MSERHKMLQILDDEYHWVLWDSLRDHVSQWFIQQAFSYCMAAQQAGFNEACLITMKLH